MKKKLLLVIIMLFILTGCSTEYYVVLGKDSIKEKITVTIPDTDIPVRTQEEINADIEVDDQITPFIEQDQYPLFKNYDIKYNKKVKKNNGITTITYDYKYKFDEFRKSNIYRQCFEHSDLRTEARGFYLHFNGKFYCLYGDEVVVKIHSKNQVNSHNADNVKGNTYTWIINKDNQDKVDIVMSVSNKPAGADSLIIIVLIVIGLVGLGFGYIFYQNVKSREMRNEI